MEKTVCLFASQNSECSGKKNAHLNNVMCDTHLRVSLGLMIHSSFVETPTAFVYSGWTLKPAPNVFFKENDVILPTSEFVDKVFRKNEAMTADERKYRINPVMNDFMRQIANDKFSRNERYAYEILRNMSQPMDKININPIAQCEDDPKPIAIIRSRIAVAETYIEKLATMNHINSIDLFDSTGVPVSLAKTYKGKLSLIFQYMLSKMEYSSHAVLDADPNHASGVVHKMNYNAMFIPNVGLVATRDISNPNTIVVFGQVKAFKEVGHDPDNFYEANVIIYPKEIVHPKVYPHQVSGQGAMRKVFLGSTHCMT